MVENSDPFITVIIPTYHDWERLQWCIDALAEQSYPEIKIEILIINNDTNDKVPKTFKLPKNAKILSENKVGSYAARNRGLKNSRGEIIGFTDSDCIPDKDWIKNAVKEFQNDMVSLIGGKVKIYKPKNGSNIVYDYEKIFSFRQHINVPKGNCVTANLFIKRSVVDKIGYFDETVNSGGDWKYTQKAVDNNLVMEYCDNVVVSHPSRKDIVSLLAKRKRIVAWGYHNRNISNKKWIIYTNIKLLKNITCRNNNINSILLILVIIIHTNINFLNYIITNININNIR